MEGQQQLFKIRDLRKKDQYKIDDKYLNGYARIFGVATTAVYNSLTRHAEFYSQKAFPSEKLIAEEHNITDRTVRTAIKKLKSANIIKCEKERNRGMWSNNVYYLVDKSEWKQPEEIKDLWLTRGNKRHSPEEITRGKINPIKDNKQKDNTYKDNKEGLPTQTRRNTSFPKNDYNEVCEAYKKIRQIEPQGFEWQPIQQSIKFMFMSKRSVEDIIGCMKWLAKSEEEWTENWTINTVKLKIAFYLSSSKKAPSVGKY